MFLIFFTQILCFSFCIMNDQDESCWGNIIWKLLLNKINTKLISQEALSVKRCLFRCSAGDKYSFNMEITTVKLPVCDLRSLFWL